MIWLRSDVVATISKLSNEDVNRAAQEGKYGTNIRYFSGNMHNKKVLQIALDSLSQEHQKKFYKNLIL